jgi:ATP-dependent DNA helicase RecG
VGNEPLENWLHRLLHPRIDFTIYEFERNGLPMVLFEIQAANHSPVRFSGEEYIRVGSSKRKLREFPEKERRLWQMLSSAQEDWSANIVEAATLAHLDPQAIQFARTEYQQRHPQHAADMQGWDDEAFLNKAKLCIRGKITNAALVLLGRDESTHFLSPAQAQITWILRNEKNVEIDYQHFGPPFILASDQARAKIRNLTVRYLPRDTLFPREATQYDPWVLRETLHNCIAHQDYTERGRINIVESPESVLFTNLGSFIPGTVEEMIQHDAPPELRRNPFLADAMVKLNMIETIGSGIKKMFMVQRHRNFPMPDYDLSDPNRVAVRLTGRILDENYTNVLLEKMDVDLMDVIALDKVQKKRAISSEEFKRLKQQKLIEGRRPNVFIAAKIAAATGDKATYIKHRGLDKKHYQELVISFLEKFGPSKKEDLAKFLLEKISDALSLEQKNNRIRNLLQEMRRNGVLDCDGHGPAAIWQLAKKKTS